MWKTLGSALWTRVILSYKSTLVGILCAAALLVLDALTGALTKAHPALAPTLAMVATLIGAALRSRQQSALAEATKEVTAPVPPSTPLALLLLLGLGLSAPGMVRADTPLYGGCLTKSPSTCFAPSVSISLVSVDLKSGSVTTGVIPGLGYGVTFNTGKWFEVGLHGYASFRDTSAGQALVPSGVISFAQYLHAGLGIQASKGSKPFLLLGIGTGFGSVPASK